MRKTNKENTKTENPTSANGSNNQGNNTSSSTQKDRSQQRTPDPALNNPPQKFNIDFQKKLRLLKSSETAHLSSVTAETANSSIPPNLPTSVSSAASRKALNIPVCEIRTVEQYDEYVQPDYVIPETYVKYVKYISEESDITVDYHADLEDEVSLIF